MKLKVPLKRQNESMTCGAACLEMVFRYYGVEITENDIASETKIQSPETDRVYIRTAHLVHFAITRGFSAFHCCMTNTNELQKILDLEMPIIVLQRHSIEDQSFAHFRVVTGIENEHFIINDPEKDEEQMISKEEFYKLWKRQMNGENVQENMFILIYPKSKQIEHTNFTYDALQFKKCSNDSCNDPIQTKILSFKCYSCNLEFNHKQIGIPFGCPNVACKKKYWTIYNCNQGHETLI